MTEALWCLRALLGHWRRSPFQLFALLLGLTVATALWSGVQAINSQARQSYDQAASLLGDNEFPIINAVTGQDFPESIFGKLRQQGWRVSPILEGEISVDGSPLKVIGIDPISYPKERTSLPLDKSAAELIAFIHPGRAVIHPGTVEKISSKSGQWITESGKIVPKLQKNKNIPPGLMIVDIAVAQDLLDKSGLLSRLLVGPPTLTPKLNENLLPAYGLQLTQPGENVSISGLTDSFHLNLTAFGFLSFFVGLFIVHSAIGLAFEQRRSMVRTLRACGVSARHLAAVLITELLFIAMIAGSIGVVVGYVIAATLLPDVSASLRGLYGADVSGELSLHYSWWLLGLGMSVLGALLAAAGSLLKAYRLPILAPASPNAWRTQQIHWLKYQAMASLLLFTVALLLPILIGGLISSFLMMGCLLLGAALLLPFILFHTLNIGQKLSSKPLTQWFWADGQQQLSGLSMALMALFLALSVNIGVGTMVESFRLTFLSWLDTRLVSEVYVRNLSDEQIFQLNEWSSSEQDVTALLPIWKVDQKISGWPTEVYGFLDHKTYREKWQLLSALDQVWDIVAAGEGLLVSEQIARKLDLSLGRSFNLPTATGPVSLKIAGIFPDYGNPKGLMMLNIKAFVKHWPHAPQNRFGLRTDPANTETLIKKLRIHIGLTEDQVIDQGSLKSFSIEVFEKTFAVTVALNSLTLLVAGISILTGLLSLSQIRLPQLAPLWAMGITRKTLARLELVKSLSLAAFTAVFAIPFGILLAWCLVAIVNVEAFGWRLPLFLFPDQWINLFLLALVTAFLSSLYPVYKLYRINADTLLKVFADER